MNRPLLFRAWIQYEPDESGYMKILEPCKINLDYEDGQALVFGIDQDDFVFESYKTDFPVMQYTGLNDKKRTVEFPDGQKIFEGDIIEVDEHYEGDHLCKKDSALVAFDEGAFIADSILRGGGYELSQLTLNKECLVVGNMFENPELLKEGQ